MLSLTQSNIFTEIKQNSKLTITINLKSLQEAIAQKGFRKWLWKKNRPIEQFQVFKQVSSDYITERIIFT